VVRARCCVRSCAASDRPAKLDRRFTSIEIAVAIDGCVFTSVGNYGRAQSMAAVGLQIQLFANALKQHVDF
jgi:hypothetical protein